MLLLTVDIYYKPNGDSCIFSFIFSAFVFTLTNSSQLTNA